MRKARALVVALVAAAGALVVGASSAAAYGPDHVYQLTFSLNCDNKGSELCAPQNFGLGGFWGWIELDSDGSYDAQVTGCNHLTGTQGASHASISDAPWTTLSSAQLPPGTSAVGVDPHDQYLVPAGLGLAFPVTAGHYSQRFGPGIIAQSQVVLMH